MLKNLIQNAPASHMSVIMEMSGSATIVWNLSIIWRLRLGNQPLIRIRLRFPIPDSYVQT
jgi:hypothetical protein